MSEIINLNSTLKHSKNDLRTKTLPLCAKLLLLFDAQTRYVYIHWLISTTGARGVWITDSCDQDHTSSGSTPTPQSPENSMGAEVLPTVQIFTTQYSQPGHFGLLLVSQGCQREF